MILQNWLNAKLKEIALKLPTLVHYDAASFACGYNTGYKQAMLDLDRIIEGGVEIHYSKCKSGDKYHEKEEICL